MYKLGEVSRNPAPGIGFTGKLYEETTKTIH